MPLALLLGLGVIFGQAISLGISFLLLRKATTLESPGGAQMKIPTKNIEKNIVKLPNRQTT